MVNLMMDAVDNWLLRYSRQILLPEVDVAGQERLQAAKVLVVGAGGLGSPVILYLAAAGVGELTVADDDSVDLSNLQRQIIHSTASLGQNKAVSAAAAATALNPTVHIHALPRRLTTSEWPATVAAHDVVVDCSDNFPTRFDLNAACYATGVPLVSGAVIRMEGQVATFDFRRAGTACYRCLYHETGESTDTCSTTGILAPVAGIIGSVQATETLKLLLGLPTLQGQLLLLDAKHMEWRTLRLRRDPTCPVCHASPLTARTAG